MTAASDSGTWRQPTCSICTDSGRRNCSRRTRRSAPRASPSRSTMTLTPSPTSPSAATPRCSWSRDTQIRYNFMYERTFPIKSGELRDNLKRFLDNLLSLLSFVSQVVLYTFSKKDVLSEIACLEIPIIYEVSLDKNENSPNFDFHARPPLR